MPDLIHPDIIKMPDPIHPDIIKTALDAGRALGQPFTAENQEQVIVIPQGYRAEAVEAIVQNFAAAPRRLKAQVKLQTLDSFISYVGDFKSEDSRVFAHVATAGGPPPSFTAIIDYHRREDEPMWCEHKADYSPKFTEEWSRWMAKNKARMGQIELAEFLEENQLLVVNPPGAELLELVQTLEGKNDIRCNSSIRLANGKSKLMYEEDVELKGSVSTQQGSIEFPSTLVVQIQLFAGGPAYQIKCRLKYRIEQRKLCFWFEAVDVHIIIADAVQAIVKEITEKLKITPLFGSVS